MTSISCKNCGGQMEIKSKLKHSPGLGFFLLILGTISVFFGGPFGILLIGIGLYMTYAKDSVWLCETCKTALPRVEA